MILITDFDLFGKNQMIYTFRQSCMERPDIDYKDGLRLLYFNTKGKEGGSNAIRNMLEYIENSRKDAAVDEATKELNRYVEDIKQNALLKGEYMTLGDLIDYEREEATKATRLADIIELLEGVGLVSEEISERLGTEQDENRFKYLLKLAARVSSIEEFEEKYNGQ